MYSIITSILLSSILLLLPENGLSIKCFQCYGDSNPSCGYKSGLTQSMVIECNSYFQYCQTRRVYNIGSNSNIGNTFWRGCQWKSEYNGCRRVRDKVVCNQECDTDLCNSEDVRFDENLGRTDTFENINSADLSPPYTIDSSNPSNGYPLPANGYHENGILMCFKCSSSQHKECEDMSTFNPIWNSWITQCERHQQFCSKNVQDGVITRNCAEKRSARGFYCKENYCNSQSTLRSSLWRSTFLAVFTLIMHFICELL